MAKTVCKVLGVVFLLVGVAGFVNQGLLGAHFTPAHNVVHLVSGAIALYFGFAGSMAAAKGFSLVFGVVYLALGILGMALGTGGYVPAWLGAWAPNFFFGGVGIFLTQRLR